MRRFRVLPLGLLLSLSLYTSGCPVVIAGAVAGGATGAVVSTNKGQEEHHSALTYVGTVVADVVYVPAKVIFAGLGAVTSGAAYLLTLGDADVSRNIWNSSVNGDYVLTPAMIDGEQPVHFTGS
jgi:hypothetical protein